MLPFALPPGHFLSLPPSFAQPDQSSGSGTASHASNGLAPNVASLAAADYDVDVRTGFLPGTTNLTRLPSDWDLWEDALSAARGDAAGQGLRLGGSGPNDRLWRRGIETVSPRHSGRLAETRCQCCVYRTTRFLCYAGVISCSPSSSIFTLIRLLNQLRHCKSLPRSLSLLSLCPGCWVSPRLSRIQIPSCITFCRATTLWPFRHTTYPTAVSKPSQTPDPRSNSTSFQLNAKQPAQKPCVSCVNHWTSSF